MLSPKHGLSSYSYLARPHKIHSNPSDRDHKSLRDLSTIRRQAASASARLPAGSRRIPGLELGRPILSNLLGPTRCPHTGDAAQ